MFFIRFLAGNIFCGLLICVISGIKKLLGDRLTRRYHYYIWFVLLISLCVVLLPDALFKAVGFSSFPMPGQSATAAAAGSTATLSGPLDGCRIFPSLSAVLIPAGLPPGSQQSGDAAPYSPPWYA